MVYRHRFAIPISGGTGAYADAHGSIRFLIGRKSDTIEVSLLPSPAGRCAAAWGHCCFSTATGP